MSNLIERLREYGPVKVNGDCLEVGSCTPVACSPRYIPEVAAGHYGSEDWDNCRVLIAHCMNNFVPLMDALETFANKMGQMMRDYDLPEECNGLICGQLD